MPPLPVISGAQCIAALARLGYQQTRQRGSHVRLVYAGRPPVTVPTHPALDRGTLRSIIRTAGVTVEEFCALL
ncbi:MAG: type II toxin-antitoxin system HicA family toxin [Deltaproteobacteria bacterium]|nr:type II toxin-antitoxin system HicA family toxin [Deltaproteobacteria bacterium]